MLIDVHLGITSDRLRFRCCRWFFPKPEFNLYRSISIRGAGVGCTPYQGKLIYHRKWGNELKQVACGRSASWEQRLPWSDILLYGPSMRADFSIIVENTTPNNTVTWITSCTNINITYFCFSVCELFICLSHNASMLSLGSCHLLQNRLRQHRFLCNICTTKHALASPMKR